MLNKKRFVPDPVTGAINVTAADLNEISDFTLEAMPSLPDAVPAWFKFFVEHSDFTAAATTQDIELVNVPAGTVVEAVLVRHTQSFGGGGITAYTLSVGVTGDLTRYIGATNVFAAPGQVLALVAAANQLTSSTAATSVRVAAVSTTANLNAATAGIAEIYVKLARAI